MKNRRSFVKFLATSTILVMVGLAAAMILMNQTVPPFTLSNPLIQNCQALIPANSSAVYIGSPTDIPYNCGGTTNAFQAANDITATPIFALPAGYDSLSISNATGAFLISNGTAIHLSGGSNYDYVAHYDGSSIITLDTFNVTWTF